MGDSGDGDNAILAATAARMPQPPTTDLPGTAFDMFHGIRPATMEASGPGRNAGASRSWPSALLWIGIPLCAIGLAGQPWIDWQPERAKHTAIVAICAWLLALASSFVLRIRCATALALWFGAALVYYTGGGPVLATVLFCAASIALGAWLVPRAPIALQCVSGLVLIAGLAGWLLPLHVHGRWIYLLSLSGLVLWKRSLLVDIAGGAGRSWRRAVAAHPAAAAWASLALGIASAGCWLPTMQADDIAYHLRLPWMLQQSGVYDMDPGLHVWAMAPWLTDVVQAFPQIMAHAESRGPVNAVWLLIAACGIWRLARCFRPHDTIAAWMAVGLFASIPLTTALAGGMQTELPTTALLSWLMVLIYAPATGPQVARDAVARAQTCTAVLFGALLGMKFGALVFALVLLILALHRHRASLPRWPRMASLVALALAIGGSSYCYAAAIAGNPFLPLFNGVFRSPYFAPENFVDAHWTGRLSALLPWNITFDTARYMDAYAGGFGFILIALAGACLLCLRERDLRTPFVACALMFAIPLIPMQYARYAFPAMAASIPLLCVAAFRIGRTQGMVLAVLLCLLDFSFQSSGNWMLHGGAIRQAMRAKGEDAPVLAIYAPERLLVSRMRAQGRPERNALHLDPETDSIAELGTQARFVDWYSRRLLLAATVAERDASGRAWANLFRAEGISDVVFRPSRLTAPRRAALALSKAELQARVADTEWWVIPQSSGKTP